MLRLLTVLAASVALLTLAGVAYAVPDIPFCDSGPCETELPTALTGAAAGGGDTGPVEVISEATAKTTPFAAPGGAAYSTSTESLVLPAGIAPSAKRCWQIPARNDRGFFSKRGYYPYYREVRQVARWCAVLGQYVYFRRVTSWTRVSDNGALCTADSLPRNYKVSGGAGYSWVTLRSEVGFTCTIPPNLPYIGAIETHWTNSVDASYNAWGARSFVRHES